MSGVDPLLDTDSSDYGRPETGAWMDPAWHTLARGRKADRGHTAVAVKTKHLRRGTRTYVKCQCGAVLSGWGHDGGDRSHRQHQARAWLRQAREEGTW